MRDASSAVLIPITSQSERDKHHRGNQQHEGNNQHHRDWQSDERRNVVNVHGNHRERCVKRERGVSQSHGRKG